MSKTPRYRNGSASRPWYKAAPWRAIITIVLLVLLVLSALSSRAGASALHRARSASSCACA